MTELTPPFRQGSRRGAGECPNPDISRASPGLSVPDECCRPQRVVVPPFARSGRGWFFPAFKRGMPVPDAHVNHVETALRMKEGPTALKNLPSEVLLFLPGHHEARGDDGARRAEASVRVARLDQIARLDRHVVIAVVSAPMIVLPSALRAQAKGSLVVAAFEKLCPQISRPSWPSTTKVNSKSRTRGGEAAVWDPG